MSERFHYFSHIEHLPGGSLILKDPFQVPADEGSICRYGPRLHGEQTLDPDPRFQGVAAYHRLLPLEREQLPEAEPILKIRPWPHPLASHLHGLSRVHFSAVLPFFVSLAKAREAGFETVDCISPGWDAAAFLQYGREEGPERHLFLPLAMASGKTGVEGFDGSIQCARETLFQLPGKGGDLSPWGNPYRVEGLKLIGLELAFRFRDRAPALLVHDLSGELLFALLAAADHYRYLRPRNLPYRLILVQEQPFDGLCREFEGGNPDWAPLADPANDRYLKPPARAAMRIAAGLADHLGSAVALTGRGDRQRRPETVFEEALERLIRNGFLDEEDEVLTISGWDADWGENPRC